MSATSETTAAHTAAHTAAEWPGGVSPVVTGGDGPDAVAVAGQAEAGEAFALAQQAACEQLTLLIGRAAACRAVGLPRSTWYRHNRISPAPPRPEPTPHVERVQPRALHPAERERIRELLNSPEYVDQAPATVWAKELDAGRYHCSVSTMYRILREYDEVHERRRQATHPPRTKPELCATRPNRVWTWDITKLAGPARGVWFCLYVLIDIFSRYTPGWMVAEREDGELARRFLHDSIAKHDIDPDTLTLHADRGTSMKSKTVAELLSDLQVTKSHSRPKTSNDNPYSEAQFKTLKYRPVFPTRFDSIEQAREFVGEFFDWYNHEHRHSGIGLHTPASVHFGQSEQIHQQREHTLAAAYAAHPERFVTGTPEPPKPPAAVWINRPNERPDTDEEAPTNPTQ